MDDQRKSLLKDLPKIDELLILLEKRGLFAKAPRELVRSFCQAQVDKLRQAILRNKEGLGEAQPSSSTEHVVAAVEREMDRLRRYRLRRVINATGIALHTNLGRAPLCSEALARVAEVGRGYANLEFDLESGKRGLRYDHIRQILCALSGAEDALVVNNNAAAVLLTLNTLAQGKEGIVSRGELIEIGGEFRIPEVMEKSGVRLREVGTTNRTRLGDYEKVICSETGVILKVHTSNFRIVGFTEDTGLEALVALGKKHQLPVIYDLGSGCFIDLSPYGLEKEPTVAEVLATGVDVVMFSGDKLPGGPQAGIILGRESLLREIKKNPLNRALRIDKLTLAALEATLLLYLRPEQALRSLPALRALTEPLDIVQGRARRLLTLLKRLPAGGLTMALREGSSLAGGGALPTREIPTVLISLRLAQVSASSLEASLRGLEVPIVARIAADEVLFDLRTIDDAELPLIKEGIKTILASWSGK